MILYKRYAIHAARRLERLAKGHPCRELHGHTFYITLTVKGDIDPSNDFVIDYFDMDTIFEEHIMPKVDHKYLNEVLDCNNPSNALCIEPRGHIKVPTSTLLQLQWTHAY